MFNTWKNECCEFYAGTPTPVPFECVLALAAKRVVLGTSQIVARLNVSTAFLHADMSADTLRLVHEEQFSTFATVWQ